VTPEAVQLVAGLNSELLPQKSKQRYIGQFFLTKVCNNYSLIHKFLINHILLQTVLLIGVCGACLRKELYTLKMENVKRRYSYPTSTRRHGNFAGVHTLLQIILSSNSAVLINIITGVSPPHY
jgi:hypothetical protein